MKKLIGMVAAMFVAGLIVSTTVGCGGGAATKASTVKETKASGGETKSGETKAEEKK